MKSIVRKSFNALGILAGAVLVVIAALYVLYPANYVTRVLRWLDSDVFDYQKFPSAAVQNSGDVAYFDKKLDNQLVSDLFESHPAIDDLESFLEETGTQAFIVIQNDAILYEEYFNGTQRDSMVTSFSMAKSFASTLIGVAIEEGYIGSVDDPITDYLPELLERDARFADIRVEDLLHMSSGIKYVETGFVNGDDSKTYYFPDLRSLALEQTEIKGEPGEAFLYNNYHPLLLGMILERATGVSVAEYLEAKIWSPLGMEYPGSWSLDSEETRFEKMESGINGRAIDFAKFGALFIHDGFWMGKQVVPEAWVKQATQPNIPADYHGYYSDDFIFASGQGYYQYMWWGLVVDEGSYDFAAIGNHGQFIYVSPRSNMVIVRHGVGYGVDAETWMDIFFQFARAIGE